MISKPSKDLASYIMYVYSGGTALEFHQTSIT